MESERQPGRTSRPTHKQVKGQRLWCQGELERSVNLGPVIPLHSTNDFLCAIPLTGRITDGTESHDDSLMINADSEEAMTGGELSCRN